MTLCWREMASNHSFRHGEMLLGCAMWFPRTAPPARRGTDPRGTKRSYGAGGEEVATSSLHVTDGVPRCPSRTTVVRALFLVVAGHLAHCVEWRAAGTGTVSAAGGVPAKRRGRRRVVGTRSAQRRRRGAAAGQCQPGAANQFLRRAGRIVAQLQQPREQIGCGVVDLSFQTPGSEHPDQLMEALELFGTKVLPHIRDV
jgi:hypothetical protein